MADQQAAPQGEEPQARQQAAFPPVPPYFRRFRGAAAEGGAGANAPPTLAPPPLPAPEATFQMFGELHTVSCQACVRTMPSHAFDVHSLNPACLPVGWGLSASC